MVAKKLKEWCNTLPDDAEINVFSNVVSSIPLPEPYIHAIEKKSIKRESGGFVSGKVISSLTLVREKR